MRVLALDISTSCVGVCLLEDDVIVVIESVEFKKCKSMFEKARTMLNYLDDVCEEHGPIDLLCIEEALMSFCPGHSSAKTISQLMRFNGMVSYIAWTLCGVEPEYVSASHARKLCGIKMQKTSVAGPQKQQVFKYMAEHDLSTIEWPHTKTGKIVSWARDATDAYVVAKASSLMNIGGKSE